MRYAARTPEATVAHKKTRFIWNTLYLVFQLGAQSPGRFVGLIHIVSPLSYALLSLKWQESN
jgi:hypothetical protein